MIDSKIHFNYQINLPMSVKERHSRRIRIEVGRVLIEDTNPTKKLGYMNVSENLVRLAYNIFFRQGAIVAQPLLLHMSYKDIPQRDGLKVLHSSKKDGFFVQCLSIEAFVYFFSVIECETVAVYPGGSGIPYKALSEELSTAMDTSLYDLILTTHLNPLGIYGYLSLGHGNLEIIGFKSTIADLFCNLQEK